MNAWLQMCFFIEPGKTTSFWADFKTLLTSLENLNLLIRDHKISVGVINRSLSLKNVIVGIICKKMKYPEDYAKGLSNRHESL